MALLAGFLEQRWQRQAQEAVEKALGAVLAAPDLIATILRHLDVSTLRTASCACRSWDELCRARFDKLVRDWTRSVCANDFAVQVHGGNVHFRHVPSGTQLTIDSNADACLECPGSGWLVTLGSVALAGWLVRPKDDVVDPFEQWRPMRLSRRGLEWNGLVETRRAIDVNVLDDTLWLGACYPELVLS